MDEQRLIERLRARAADDARRFREKHPGETPTEIWIDNSFTATLPLAASDAGAALGPGPNPHLFAVYREEIDRRLGERESRRDVDDTINPEPTPGEN